MAVIKGVDVLIKIGAQVVGGQRNASLEMSSEVTDITTKSSNGWSEKVAGLKSWTTSCDGIYFVSDAGLKAVQTAFMSGNSVEIAFTGGGINYTGTALITSMSAEAGQEDVVAYTIAFEGTGALDLGTVE